MYASVCPSNGTTLSVVCVNYNTLTTWRLRGIRGEAARERPHPAAATRCPCTNTRGARLVLAALDTDHATRRPQPPPYPHHNPQHRWSTGRINLVTLPTLRVAHKRRCTCRGRDRVPNKQRQPPSTLGPAPKGAYGTILIGNANGVSYCCRGIVVTMRSMDGMTDTPSSSSYTNDGRAGMHQTGKNKRTPSNPSSLALTARAYNIAQSPTRDTCYNPHGNSSAGHDR